MSNSNFQFDSYMFSQLACTAMGTKLPPLLPLHFPLTGCKLIKEIFKCLMGDGFVLCPKNPSIDVFREILNELHPD